MGEGKRVILHIDDNEDCLATVRAVLESEGYTVVNASSAEEGLKTFEGCDPGLIIVDLMMEDIDSGAQLAKDLKARAGDVPIFMLTGVGDEMSQTVDVTQLGISGVLQKPIDPARLVTLVESNLT